MEHQRIDADDIALALRVPGTASSDYDLNPRARPSGSRALRAASVLVPLVERAGAMNVVLTRRATRLAHHPGQVAFPGGKQEDGDADALATALREAHEEIGLQPSQVHVLGAFDPHETVTNFMVSPFVGLVSGFFEPRPERGEVDEVFEVPLDFVLDPANLQVHRVHRGGNWRHYYALPYGPHYIWGATARILKGLSDRLVSR